jgi:hypothetical protein
MTVQASSFEQAVVVVFESFDELAFLFLFFYDPGKLLSYHMARKKRREIRIGIYVSNSVKSVGE